MSELLPLGFHHLEKSQTRSGNYVGGSFGSAWAAESESGRLDFEWEGRLSFRYAETMTEEEARKALADMAYALGIAAMVNCHAIIDSIPLDVVPTILPQLQDIAEYETRMQQVRREVEGPDILERWISLPVAT